MIRLVEGRLPVQVLPPGTLHADAPVFISLGNNELIGYVFLGELESLQERGRFTEALPLPRAGTLSLPHTLCPLHS